MVDEPEKRTHAQRRRLEARKASANKLRAGQFVRRLKEIAEKAETVEASQVPALRLKADIYCRLLAKCLPDLKAVELSGDVTQQHTIAWNPIAESEWEETYGVGAPAGPADSSH